MTRRARPLLLALALGAGAAVPGIATATTSIAHTRTGLVVTDRLFRGGTRVGTERTVCTDAPRGAARPSGRLCTLTFTLPRGTITVRLPTALGAGSGRFTVTGGTGGSAGAKGTGTFSDSSPTRTAFSVRLRS